MAAIFFDIDGDSSAQRIHANTQTKNALMYSYTRGPAMVHTHTQTRSHARTHTHIASTYKLHMHCQANHNNSKHTRTLACADQLQART